jgi:hypothetical protein
MSWQGRLYKKRVGQAAAGDDAVLEELKGWMIHVIQDAPREEFFKIASAFETLFGPDLGERSEQN